MLHLQRAVYCMMPALLARLLTRCLASAPACAPDSSAARHCCLPASYSHLQLCFSPGSCDVLVSGGYDQAVKVWDCRSRSIDAIQVGPCMGGDVASHACWLLHPAAQPWRLYRCIMPPAAVSAFQASLVQQPSSELQLFSGDAQREGQRDVGGSHRTVRTLSQQLHGAG